MGLGVSDLAVPHGPDTSRYEHAPIETVIMSAAGGFFVTRTQLTVRLGSFFVFVCLLRTFFTSSKVE